MGDVKFKSKSEMLMAIRKNEELDSFGMLYVGDINADYEAANKSNMKFIFAEWGYEERDMFQYPLSASCTKDLTRKIFHSI